MTDFTMPAAGDDLSDPETKAAVAGFLSELRGLAADVTTRLQQQDDRMTQIDRRMSHAAGRPPRRRTTPQPRRKDGAEPASKGLPSPKRVYATASSKRFHVG